MAGQIQQEQGKASTDGVPSQRNIHTYHLHTARKEEPIWGGTITGPFILRYPDQAGKSQGATCP